jgi:ribonuclease R/exosome complex exonuclease DIS3/RRP44
MTKKKRNIYKKKGRVIKDLNRKILKVFSTQNKTPLNYKQIAASLKIEDSDGRNQILKKLAEMQANGRIKEESRGKFILNAKDHYHTGVLDVTSNGNAYFICEDFEDDVFIPSRNINNGLHKDTVQVYVYKRKRNGKMEGDVVSITERYKTEFVGVLQENKNFGFVVADDNKMYADLFIKKSDFNGALNGDKVVAEIVDWPSKSKSPFAKITKVLGKPGEHQTEMHSILVDYGLPYDFPEEVEHYASKLPIEITEQEIAKRKDMRDVLTFTIDPKDAKDFDDALSYEVLDNGLKRIGVHIADVSHYLQEGTLLDDEAFDRATSVYLVDRVVPMLPEILSNNVCSLRPHEEKLCFSALFTLNENAEVVDKWFGRTVIYSDQRFTYEDAQEIIEGKEHALSPAVLDLDKLAKILRQKRLNKGALTFDKVEVKFNLDEEANPIGVFFKRSLDANKLIEEFMLLANREVAQFIGEAKGKPSGKTFIYRVHDEPNIDKLEALNNLVHKFGYGIDTSSRNKISKSLNTLLSDVAGKAESNMVETLAIRTMSKAEYTTKNIGHYGLAFDYYSHFTSPIRRYPDVMTHRLLQHYLDGGKSPNSDSFEEKCGHCSEREQLASRAERDSIKYMQVKYMEDHKDQEFEGVISGVTEWGIYVEISENKCEGMVRIRDIKDDYYVFSEEQYALVGQSTKNLYQLGDLVKVKVKNTDLERKHLDFTLLSKLNF